MYDTIIIGAGIAGTGLAYFLKDNARVAIIDMEDHAGYHTTGRSAAFYAETYGGKKIQPLTSASKAFFQNPPDGFQRALWTERGCVFPFDARRQALGEAKFKAMRSVLPSISLLSAEEVGKLAPILREGYASGALYDPDCTDLDVAALHQGFMKAFYERGGELFLGAGLEKATFEKGHWRLETRQGELKAKVIVNAAGAWGDEVAARCGVDPVGLTPLRRTLMTTENPFGAPFNKAAPLVIDIEDQFYFKPEGTGYLISPCDETLSSPCDTQPEALDVARGVKSFEEVTGTVVERVLSKWAGLRTFAKDRAPVIGYDQRQKSFFWNVGQGGYGIQTSPAWSALAASLLLQEGLPTRLASFGINPSHYSPARFTLERV